MVPRASNDRTLTLDEAVSVALALQQAEQWEAAEDIYRTVLQAAPNHPDALHFSGVLAHQRGRSDDAIALIERSLELKPERADWYSNLGIVLQQRLRLDDAITAYRSAIAQVAVPICPLGLELEAPLDQRDRVVAPSPLMGEHA